MNLAVLKRVELNLKDEIPIARICMEHFTNVLKTKNSGSFFTWYSGNLTIYEMTLRTPADQKKPYSLFSIRECSHIPEDDDNGTVVHMHLRDGPAQPVQLLHYTCKQDSAPLRHGATEYPQRRDSNRRFPRLR